MGRMTHSMARLTLGISLAAAVSTTQAQTASDALYYDIGGAAPISVSAGRGHSPSALSMGAKWNLNATCGNFDMGASVSNQLNGITNGFQNLMGDVVQNATGAVASLPAMVIQRANPQLYDLLQNGVLQGRLDYDKTKLSCQQMAEQMTDFAMGEQSQQAAQAENWKATAKNTQDPVAAQEVVEEQGGNKGRTWVGGQKRGGENQEPMEIVEDTAIAGYNQLHGRNDPTSTQSVSGGGQGWGSVSTNDGDWPGGGSFSNTASGDCQGGMCTVWQDPQEAADWTKSVIGETEIRTCDGCDKRQGQAGTGLMKALEEEQTTLAENLADLVSGNTDPTPSALNAVSAGPGLSVSRGVIEAIRKDPDAELLTQRLAGEMALSRTLTKAMWARRMLLAGASEPGIANNEEGVTELERKLTHLDRDIDALKSELEVRTALANNAAQLSLQRSRNRARALDRTETRMPDSSLDNRGRPTDGGSD